MLKDVAGIDVGRSERLGELNPVIRRIRLQFGLRGLLLGAFPTIAVSIAVLRLWAFHKGILEPPRPMYTYGLYREPGEWFPDWEFCGERCVDDIECSMFTDLYDNATLLILARDFHIERNPSYSNVKWVVAGQEKVVRVSRTTNTLTVVREDGEFLLLDIEPRGAYRTQTSFLQNRVPNLLAACRLSLPKSQRQAFDQFTENLQVDVAFDQAWEAQIQGEFRVAIDGFSRVIRFDPNDAEAYLRRGHSHSCAGNFGEAIDDFSTSIRLNADPITYCFRASSWAAKGDYGKAIDDYNAALSLDASMDLAHNELAWLLATCPEGKYRDGAKALEHAEKACQLRNWEDPLYFDALAAAYAETGDFEKAVHWQGRAMQGDGQPVAQEDEIRLNAAMEAYKAGRPFRYGAQSSTSNNTQP